jgi:SAM-dependent methyltransferase
LSEYYRNSYAAFDGQEPDYDIGKRLSFLTEVAPKCEALVEIGSNRRTKFHDRLAERCKDIRLVELNESIEGADRSFEDLGDCNADVVVHYFVLEHVARAGAFLQNCYRILRVGGVMVCEVPDLSIYPQDPSGLLYEHTNHFSIGVLCQLARKIGFELIKTDVLQCSRPFGFAAAFRKGASPAPSVPTRSEYEDNRSCFIGGLKKLEEQRKVFRKTADAVARYERQHVSVLFWAANELMATYFSLHQPNKNVSVFDSNPEKQLFFGTYQVSTPAQDPKKIHDAQAIFLFTRLHARAILQDIKMQFGKEFDPTNVHIVA